ncbi:MAG TPA: protein kinase family protein [Streptosporangiaceae bacterium]|nr:protein kinase family protein [Streptosporangiaceae bacterium]
MSTYTSEPGTRLAGRYRLEDQVDAGGGWTLWKAIDEILARAVTVLMFAGGFPRIHEAVTAARAASRLTDSRLSQVFDVDDSGERAYIVMEWVAGDSLADMLSEGPLEPSRAVSLTAEAAQALAAAHAAGLAHLRLGPGSLRWTPGGGVKITGLGIDAALAGLGADSDAPEDPALTDTRGLARLLYAALTGYWAGPQPSALPPAPMLDGAPCSPRQVSADVPVSIDSVTCQALFQRQGRNGAVITTPLELADALSRLAPPVPPAPAPPPHRGADRTGRGPETSRTARYGGQRPAPRPDPPAWGGGPPERPRAAYQRAETRRGRGAALKTLIGVVAVLVVAAAVATAWSFSHTSAHGTPQAGRHGTSAGPSTVASVPLKPVSAHGFDPLSSDPGNEDDAGAHFAIDGNPSTSWDTQYYVGNPVFGGLKKGTGLILDMGKPVRLSQVQVQFGSSCCASVQIQVGNDNTRSAATLNTFTTVASSTKAFNETTFNVTSSARGRYVLIWFTSLPPMASNPGRFMAQVYNVAVRGSS